MIKYRVDTEFWSSVEFTSLQEAEAKFTIEKDNLMSEGVVENESYVQIVKSEDDFEDYTVIKKIIAVRDNDRQELGTPQEEGFEWDYWAKWLEVED
jgi:hypothetical protein